MFLYINMNMPDIEAAKTHLLTSTLERYHPDVACSEEDDLLETATATNIHLWGNFMRGRMPFVNMAVSKPRSHPELERDPTVYFPEQTVTEVFFTLDTESRRVIARALVDAHIAKHVPSENVRRQYLPKLRERYETVLGWLEHGRTK